MSAEQSWIQWVNGLSDPGPAIREFAVQYHYFSMHQIVAFSRALASISPENRRALSRLASVLRDELGTPGTDEAHSLVFERFALSAGVAKAQLPPPASRVHPAVRSYVRTLESAFSSAAPPHVLGAYLFLEGSAVRSYDPILQLLRSLASKVPNLDLEFFEIHATLEPSHLDEAEELVRDHKLSAADFALLEWQKQRLSNRWDAFWVGVTAACEAATASSVVKPHPWRSDAVFLRLCDLVASDRLVCLTGAGISSRIPRANGMGCLPSWPQLLRELRDCMRGDLGAEEQRDVDDIVDAIWPSGRLLIQASSILRSSNPKKFDESLRVAVTGQDGATSDTHRAIAAIRPRGIFTFNYDTAHESAAAELSYEHEILVPYGSSDSAIVQALATGLSKPFVLKAHGSLGHNPENLVLTSESYRELMTSQPAYRALVQHVLTEFHLLIVGFGLSDPDFDLLIDTLVDAYGSAVRDAVVIRHRREEGPDEIRLRRRYGIQTLYVDSFADIPRVILDASEWEGPQLRASLDEALAPGSTTARSHAHTHLRSLGAAGRASAAAVLLRDLQGVKHSGAGASVDFQKSEIVYSLGVVADKMSQRHERDGRRMITEAIIAVVEQDLSVDAIARALTVLRPLLEAADVERIKEWQARFANPPFDLPAASRLKIYADYLGVYIPAKYNSEPRVTALEPEALPAS